MDWLFNKYAKWTTNRIGDAERAGRYKEAEGLLRGLYIVLNIPMGVLNESRKYRKF